MSVLPSTHLEDTQLLYHTLTTAHIWASVFDSALTLITVHIWASVYDSALTLSAMSLTAVPIQRCHLRQTVVLPDTSLVQ